MIVARTIPEARAALGSLPRPLGFVPTMGALHAGHLSLVAAAKARCASVAASLFVNPAQFGRGEDLATYPRDEARDLALFEDAGVAVVFAPTVDDMYPDGFATGVHVGGPLTESFEGASRPAHFDGVTTIVAKLLGVVQPDVLFLGEKDAQQLAVLRRMVCDLDLPIVVAGVPVVRDRDGLALSSRNVYLTPEQRAVAPNLHRALLAGAGAARLPGATVEDVIAAAMSTLLPEPSAAGSREAAARPDGATAQLADAPAQPGDAAAGPAGAGPAGPRFALDYLAVVDADTFVPETALGPRSRLIAAARLGSTRLIDNLALAVPAAGEPTTRPPSSAYPAEDATT